MLSTKGEYNLIARGEAHKTGERLARQFDRNIISIKIDVSEGN